LVFKCPDQKQVTAEAEPDKKEPPYVWGRTGVLGIAGSNWRLKRVGMLHMKDEHCGDCCCCDYDDHFVSLEALLMNKQ